MSQQTQDVLTPPETLSTAPQWIVRLKGKDMGPFSSAEIYPLLLTGEVEPQTLLLDQNNFQRCRLETLSEFQPFLGLHNTHNPILLEEQRQQEKDEHWENVGKKRMYLSIAAVVLLAVSAFLVWRFVFYKSKDKFIASGDFQFSVNTPFKAVQGKFKDKDWKAAERSYLRKMRKVWARNRKANGGKAGGSGGANAAIDMSGGGSVPYAKIRSKVRRKIATIFPCFKQQYQRDNNFEGGVLRFIISGSNGRVKSVAMHKGDGSRILMSCVRRRTNGWSFQKFPSSAVIFFPLWISRR
jgi:hypothetical protein